MIPLPDDLAATAAERLNALQAACESHGVASPENWPGDIARVFACSDFVYHSCMRAPHSMNELLEQLESANLDAAQLEQDLQKQLESCDDETSFYNTLRIVRRQHMVRIAWRDIGGLCDFESVMRETSDVADVIVRVALDWLEARMVERGVASTPVPPRMVVFALGKLGAGELNFSSDVDLIYAYADDEPGHAQHFITLAQRLTRALNEHTEEGFVFRVDLRLRPFGRSGPLAMGFDAMEGYYQTHGRDWERYALIRARTIAGDVREGAQMLQRLRPFVYRRYLDFGALESMRAMKAMITGEVKRRGLDDHLKLGPGGIREIEFTGQSFQLVRGGRQASLQSGQILAVLAELARQDLLPAQAVEELSVAYRFLRTSEHRLQQVDDSQTHTVPAHDEGRLRLAVGMGYTSWQEYAQVLDRMRRHVRSHFEQVFGTDDADRVDVADNLSLVWLDEADDDSVCGVLQSAGFEQPHELLEPLRHFLHASGIRLIDEQGRRRMERLLPSVLRASAEQHNAHACLTRMLSIMEAVARRSTYIALLAERPLALSQLVRLCSASPWITAQIRAHPVLLDELLDARSLYAPLAADDLADDLRIRLGNVTEGDIEQEMDALRQFKQANVLRVAAADVANAIPLMVVSDYLTSIAEAALRGALELAWRDMQQRYGEPCMRVGQKLVRAPFAIIGYGKLGGLELGYGSDIDIVFVHGSEGREQHTNGDRSVDNARFFDRLAQRIVHYLSTVTAQGKLYEVDLRLRPSGGAGMLVNSLSGLQSYLRDEAWTWEHQALVRARAVAGDETLMNGFSRLRRSILLTKRDHNTLRREVREMRERMRDELNDTSGMGVDLKQTPGGIADIEFMVQYAALRWADALESYLDFPDNIRLLEGFEAKELMDAGNCRLLTDAFRSYRACVHDAALQESQEVRDTPELQALRAAVLDVWQSTMATDDGDG